MAAPSVLICFGSFELLICKSQAQMSQTVISQKQWKLIPVDWSKDGKQREIKTCQICDRDDVNLMKGMSVFLPVK